MRYQIKTVSEAPLFYDTERNNFSFNGVSIDSFVPFCPESERPFVIRLAMGVRCNMSCHYCQQSPIKGTRPDTPFSFEIIDKALELSNQFGNERPIMVQFWGGEPLLYFDQVKEFYNRFSKVVSKGRDQYYIMTNGLLLDREKAVWLTENKIKVGLSYDGPGQRLRGVDILGKLSINEAVRYLAKNEMIMFSPVWTNLNKSISVYRQSLREYLGDCAENVSLGEFSPVRPIDEQGADCAMSVEDLQAWSKELYIELLKQQDDRIEFGVLNLIAIDFLRSLNDFEYRPGCNIRSPRMINLEPDGSIRPCFSMGELLFSDGRESHSIFEEKLDLTIGLDEHVDYWKSKCKDCIVRFLCRGDCPGVPLHLREKACSFATYRFLPIFGLAVHILTGEYMLEAVKAEE